MSFTKITHAGIGSTGTVLLENLEVTGVGTFGGSVSVGGTLTYEDVTNIDSVGLITARNGIVVGSGITLSKDGDVFFTGIATGNGSGLTALNASNISSGTVPTARLGSGTASSSTFLRGDSTFQTVDTNLVADTTPQLGGNLDTNDKNIVFGDSSGSTVNRLNFGAGTDLSIRHDGTDTIFSNSTGDLYINNAGTNSDDIILSAKDDVQIKVQDGETGMQVIGNGAVELFYDNALKFKTVSGGVRTNGNLELLDNHEIQIGSGADLKIYHDGSHTYIDNQTGNLNIRGANNENAILYTANGAIKLYHDNTQRFETVSKGFRLVHSTGNVDFNFNRFIVNAGQTFFIDHTATGADFKFRTSDSSGLDTEALQILGSGSLYNKSRSGSQSSLTLRKQISGADGIDYFQCRNSSNTLKLQIQGTGDVRNTNNSYGQISDIKLKENIVDANSQWNDIKSIRVRNWNFKESTGLPTHKQIGVVAQELETVSAGLVDEQIDRDNDTGKDLGTTTKGVKYSILYMKSVKALQEAMTRIETLETKVAALEG